MKKTENRPMTMDEIMDEIIKWEIIIVGVSMLFLSIKILFNITSIHFIIIPVLLATLGAYMLFFGIKGR